MATGQAHENIFQAGLAGGQVQELCTLFSDGIQQRRDSQVRLVDRKADQAIVVAHGLYTGKSSPNL